MEGKDLRTINPCRAELKKEPGNPCGFLRDSDRKTLCRIFRVENECQLNLAWSCNADPFLGSHNFSFTRLRWDILHRHFFALGLIIKQREHEESYRCVPFVLENYATFDEIAAVNCNEYSFNTTGLM